MITKILITLIILLSLGLRLWDITNFPSGFNADEASLGYNAYSILKTGRDEYGSLLPLNLKSFGDYKPALYAYITIPFIAIFGLNEFAVRLPSVLSGVATVLLIYFLARKIFEKESIALLAAFFLAITPWHIHFSRGAWESNLATLFITLGVYFFIKGQKQYQYFFYCLLAFLFSMYTYQSPRLIVPALIFVLLLIYRDFIIKIYKKTFKFLVVIIILAVPLFLQFTSGEGAARFSGLFFLADSGPGSRVNQLRGEHNNPSGLQAQILHNKFTGYTPSLLGHYLDHFTPNFLFINGDAVIRNKVPETGQFYLIESILLIIGFVYLIKSNNRYKALVISWVLIAPLASALTFQTPSALRSLNMVVPLTLMIAFGFWNIKNIVKNNSKFIVYGICLLLLLFEFIHYLESYYVHYPKRYPLAWEYGFSQMVDKLNKYEGQYKNIVISDQYDQPYILVLFYKQFDPKKYQPQASLSVRDRFNFGTVRSFDKYQFKKVTEDEIRNSKDTLFIGSPEEIPQNVSIIDQVDFPNGKPSFIFVKT